MGDRWVVFESLKGRKFVHSCGFPSWEAAITAIELKYYFLVEDRPATRT